MIQIYVCTNENEEKLFQILEINLSRNTMWQNCDLYTTQTVDKWMQWVKEQYPIDILVCDVTKKGAIEALKKARKKHAEALIIPLADRSVLPAEYVTPEILPFTLLWKPITCDSLRDTLLYVISHIYEKKGIRSAKSFELITKQETRYIPYEEILYFEARDKKIYLRLKHQEICFYTTLGSLEKQLPENFIRCHKSYIINSNYIANVEWSDQMINLQGQIAIPLSRTYRNRFKEELYGGRVV